MEPQEQDDTVMKLARVAAKMEANKRASEDGFERSKDWIEGYAEGLAFAARNPTPF